MKNIILWSSSAIILILVLYLYSITSDYYPVSGTVSLDQQKITYKFDKITDLNKTYLVLIRVDDPNIKGVLHWYDTSEHIEKMYFNNFFLTSVIPATNFRNIKYYVTLYSNGKNINVPKESINLKYQGNIPGSIWFIYYLTLWAGLFLTIRLGLGYFNKNSRAKVFSFFIVIFFFLYAAAVIPIMNTYRLGAINNFVPGVKEIFRIHPFLLFVNSTLCLYFLFKKNATKMTLISSIAAIIIYLFVRS